MGRSQRAVGIVVFGTAMLGAGLLWWGVAAGDHRPGDRPSEGLIFGVWRVLYDTEAPTPRVVVAAAGVALMVAAFVAWSERRIATRARRSLDPTRMPLSPKVVMGETRGVFAGPVTITALIPAHNEEACLEDTLTSLLAQSHRPERVVVADNCADATVEIARRMGVEVLETVGQHKKAGALNQLYPRDWLPSSYRCAETRSIYPDGPR